MITIVHQPYQNHLTYNNHLTEITIAEDPQIEEIHKISHRIDIFDQTDKTIKIEISFQDQTQTEKTTRSTKGIVHTQTFEIDTIEMTVLENPHITEPEITQTIGIDIIQITDHKPIKTIDQTIKIIKREHVKIPRTEILTIQIDKEFILSHHIEIIHYQNSQQKYRSSTLKHQRQINQVQTTEETQSDPPGIDNTEKSDYN